MKTLIGLTAFTLTLLTLAPTVLAEGVGNSETTHIAHSASHPLGMTSIKTSF